MTSTHAVLRSSRLMRMAGPVALCTALAFGAAGCATAPRWVPGAAPPAAPPAEPDPWQNFNRKIFGFNEKLDEYVLKPVAEGYRKVVPKPVRTGVDNFFGNIRDVWSAANQLLQFKLQYGLEMGMRVVVNTTVGLAGILDPATEMGLMRRSEDFGQTLGWWGLASGPYLVLPLFGPSTVRDTGGLTVDRIVWQYNPSQLPSDTGAEYAVGGLEVVNTRTNLLDTGDLISQASLDKYSFIRDAWLARRRNEVYDGAAAADTFDYGSSGDDKKAQGQPGAGPALLAPAAAASAPPGRAGGAPDPGRPAPAPARAPAAPASAVLR